MLRRPLTPQQEKQPIGKSQRRGEPILNRGTTVKKPMDSSQPGDSKEESRCLKRHRERSTNGTMDVQEPATSAICPQTRDTNTGKEEKQRKLSTSERPIKENVRSSQRKNPANNHNLFVHINKNVGENACKSVLTKGIKQEDDTDAFKKIIDELNADLMGHKLNIGESSGIQPKTNILLEEAGVSADSEKNANQLPHSKNRKAQQEETPGIPARVMFETEGRLVRSSQRKNPANNHNKFVHIDKNVRENACMSVLTKANKQEEDPDAFKKIIDELNADLVGHKLNIGESSGIQPKTNILLEEAGVSADSEKNANQLPHSKNRRAQREETLEVTKAKEMARAIGLGIKHTPVPTGHLPSSGHHLEETSTTQKQSQMGEDLPDSFIKHIAALSATSYSRGLAKGESLYDVAASTVASAVRATWKLMHSLPSDKKEEKPPSS